VGSEMCIRDRDRVTREEDGEVGFTVEDQRTLEHFHP